MDTYRTQLMDELSDSLRGFSAPKRRLLPQDRWVLGSLLQKAIRRDEPGWALQAASTLLQNEPQWFWRRIPVIALEDVSFGDLNLVSVALEISRNQARQRLGDDWAVASHIVQRLCAATKCRSPNDLVEIGAFSPCSRGILRAFEELDFEDLVAISVNVSEDHISRYLAAASIASPERSFARHTKHNLETFLESVSQLPPDSIHHTVVEALKLGWSHSLAIHALRFDLHLSEPVDEIDDWLPRVTILGGVPSYAFDMHCRCGAKATRDFINRTPAIRSVLNEIGIEQTRWFDSVRHAMFELEAGLLRHRLHHPLCIRLRETAETLGFGRNGRNAVTLKAALIENWAAYEARRTDAVNGNS